MTPGAGMIQNACTRPSVVMTLALAERSVEDKDLLNHQECVNVTTHVMKTVTKKATKKFWHCVLPSLGAMALALIGLLLTPTAGADTPAECEVYQGQPSLPYCLLLVEGLLNNTGYRLWTRDHTAVSDGVRRTGPYLAGASAATHARSRVYYSDAVVAWLRAGRKGDIPDQAMIIKEMYAEVPPKGPDDPVTGWAMMVRNSAGSHDGWLWLLYYRPDNATNGRQFLGAQQGMSFCLACHASADSSQLTFASLNNIDDINVQMYAHFDLNLPLNSDVIDVALPPVVKRDSTHSQFTNQQSNCQLSTKGDLPEPREQPNPSILATYNIGQVVRPDVARPLPMDTSFDHVPVPENGADTFISADNCSGCHDASSLAGSILPEMMVATTKGELYNLSPWGEWSASMMGLAARDPIFLAQIESEIALRPDRGAYIQEFCFSCHAVQGARQFQSQGGRGFNKDMLYATGEDEHSKVGALGRGGVACTTCHHITPDGLGTPASFNGRFKTGPADHIYGPFTDPLVYPMQQSVGLTPQHGGQIGSSALCGSCHTVIPRAIPRGAPGDPSTFKPVHEQTTYLEWLNSDYRDGGPGSKTCAGCHMPESFHLDPKTPLAFRVATVEDGRFPAVPHRADDAKVNVSARPYRRHTLVGVNAFALGLFQQFPEVLGHCVFDAAGLTPGVEQNPIPRIRLAGDEAVRMAQQSTRLDIRDARLAEGRLSATVRVTNLAGHKFPSGVGFRRAVLQFEVKSADGRSLWRSGGMNDSGVIVGAGNTPLPSEFTTQPTQLLPDFDIINDPDQVQIYEQRHADNLGSLTTSFFSLFNEVKDNRILPSGWSPTGPSAAVTWPIAKGGKRVTSPVAGYDEVRYAVAVPRTATALEVVATLVYQAAPPYYLADRFATVGQETDRLKSLVAYANFEGSPLAGFRLVLAGSSVHIAPAGEQSDTNPQSITAPSSGPSRTTPGADLPAQEPVAPVAVRLTAMMRE